MEKKNLKRQRIKEINKKYDDKLKKRIQAGDPDAIAIKKHKQHASYRSTAKNFIKNYATRQEISELRDLMAARVIELRKKDKKI